MVPRRRPDKALGTSDILTGEKEGPRRADIGSRLWASNGWHPAVKESPRATKLTEEDFEGDTIEVETPSRGPRGRKIDVFGGIV